MGREAKHRAAGKVLPEMLPRGFALGVLAASALASGGLALNSSATANAACAAVGGLGKIGDGSCSATGQGSFAFSLFPGSTANATGDNSTAIAIGLNNTASTGDGAGNHALAIGTGNTASSLLGDNNRNTAIGINNTATSVGSAASITESTQGSVHVLMTTAATGSNNNNTAFGFGNSATSLFGDGSRNTAVGIDNAASTLGSAAISRLVTSGQNSTTYTYAAVGKNNKVTAFGNGNNAAAGYGNGNDVNAVGVDNRALTFGSQASTEVEVIDYTVEGLGFKQTTASAITATGNNNRANSFGYANRAAVYNGNDNAVTAAGHSNAAAIYGSPGSQVVTDTSDPPSVPTSTTVLKTALGNGNRAVALGRHNVVITNLGNRNDSRVFGRENTATVTGSAGLAFSDGTPSTAATGIRNRLRVFGRNSAATANEVNDQTVTAKGNDATAP